jgi:hypothetical protein
MVYFIFKLKNKIMNRKLKIALGVAVGIGVIYLGYRYFFKSSENEGTDTSKENIVHDKASREVVLVQNN